jgi:putative addiction module component (TIGR02574 family)
MTVDASKYLEDGLSLPPSVRKDVALRLLESVEVVDESVDETWTDEISSRVDDIVSGKVKTIPGEQVFANLAARRAEREAARNA